MDAAKYTPLDYNDFPESGKRGLCAFAKDGCATMTYVEKYPSTNTEVVYRFRITPELPGVVVCLMRCGSREGHFQITTQEIQDEMALHSAL